MTLIVVEAQISDFCKNTTVYMYTVRFVRTYNLRIYKKDLFNKELYYE